MALGCRASLRTKSDLGGVQHSRLLLRRNLGHLGIEDKVQVHGRESGGIGLLCVLEH